MKKLFFAVLVTLIGLAFTAPAFAVDHQFGGYWRTRMYTQQNYSGNDDGSQDVAQAESRTRLYYTAIINDNLKLVNKFEMDATWGDATSYGDLGADGKTLEIKNSYAEFTMGDNLFKVGTMGADISRGFIFSNDFSGVVAVVGPATFLYAKAIEGGVNMNDDIAVYHLSAGFDLGAVKLTPGFTYHDINAGDDAWMLALDIDSEMFWATLIYEGGDLVNADTNVQEDISAWLVAAGASVGVSDMLSVHGQAFYATGDDNAADGDNDAFTTLPGTRSYYWAEIMGYSTFDMQAPANGTLGDNITNVMAFNMGVTATPMDKLKLTADLWYAVKAEDNAAGDDDLGIEIDLKATYQLVEGLSLDLVGAYLFAGDVVTENATNDENPWILGTQLSLSF